MKLDFATATLVLAVISSVAAAPAADAQVKVTQLTVRESNLVNSALANLQHYNAKRDLMSQEEIIKRENQIVTDVLTAIKTPICLQVLLNISLLIQHCPKFP